MVEKTTSSTMNSSGMASDTPSSGRSGATSKKKTATKPKKQSTKSTHPRTSEMVNEAIETLREKQGSSFQAIKKYIGNNYKLDAEKHAPFIKKYLKTAVTTGSLVQTRGKGASGSFKIASAKFEGTTKSNRIKSKLEEVKSKTPVKITKKNTRKEPAVAVKKAKVAKNATVKKTVAAAIKKKKIPDVKSSKTRAITAKSKATIKTSVKKSSPKKTTVGKKSSKK